MDVLELSDLLSNLNDSNVLIYIKDKEIKKVPCDTYNPEFKEVKFNTYGLSNIKNSENPVAEKIIMFMATIPKEAELLIGQYNQNYTVFIKNSNTT